MSEQPSGPNGAAPLGAATRVQLDARPERRLIRPSGSRRHVDFALRVEAEPAAGRPRPPLTLALVIDRSGSMARGKLATAKQAALAVVDRLDERDQAAVVVFDDHIDVVQPAVSMTAADRQRVHSALAGVEARGSTALHEGWLVGCENIAAEQAERGDRLARCFLLTDGLANVGTTDPEQIATEAAGVRERAAICTSTFGIGADYDEGLLGPLAVAGGGQFHHLRRPEEIARTFVGELEGLFAVALRGVRLEIEAAPGVQAEIVSEYWVTPAADGATRWTVALGDLGAGEERHVVVRLAFPPGAVGTSHGPRARLVWAAHGGEARSAWQEVRFTYADHAACDGEAHDAAVMHWVGLHHAEKAEREALAQNRRGDFAGARKTLDTVRRRIASYAGADQALQERAEALEALAPAAAAPMAPMVAKEQYAEAQRRSRGQVDRRNPQP
jgi:Ca-activated chloride channel family protein